MELGRLFIRAYYKYCAPLELSLAAIPSKTAGDGCWGFKSRLDFGRNRWIIGKLKYEIETAGECINQNRRALHLPMRYTGFRLWYTSYFFISYGRKLERKTL